MPGHRPWVGGAMRANGLCMSEITDQVPEVGLGGLVGPLQQRQRLGRPRRLPRRSSPPTRSSSRWTAGAAPSTGAGSPGQRPVAHRLHPLHRQEADHRGRPWRAPGPPRSARRCGSTGHLQPPAASRTVQWLANGAVIPGQTGGGPGSPRAAPRRRSRSRSPPSAPAYDPVTVTTKATKAVARRDHARRPARRLRRGVRRQRAHRDRRRLGRRAPPSSGAGTPTTSASPTPPGAKPPSPTPTTAGSSKVVAVARKAGYTTATPGAAKVGPVLAGRSPFRPGHRHRHPPGRQPAQRGARHLPARRRHHVVPVAQRRADPAAPPRSATRRPPATSARPSP